MKLFGHVNRKSPHSFKLQVALAESRAPYEYLPVDLANGAHRTPEFPAINSHGQLPVLVDGDFVLAESNAISWYVAEAFPDAGLLPPVGEVGAAARQQRARILQWCDFSSSALHTAYAEVYLHTAALALQTRNSATAEAAMQRFSRVVAVMASNLGTQPFIAGSYSLADIALASVVQAARMRLPDADPANHPAIDAWMDRVTARPAWADALAAAG